MNNFLSLSSKRQIELIEQTADIIRNMEYYVRLSPKGMNVNNPVQAAGAARGKGILPLPQNSVGVQPASGLRGVCDVCLPRVPLRSTRGYSHSSPAGI